MIIKKQAVLYSCSNISSLFATTLTSHTTTHTRPSIKPHRVERSARNEQNFERRKYATIASDQSSTIDDHLAWPETTGSQKIPDPYQIFNQKRGEAYSKRRFYQLVKLYHPDRYTHNTKEGDATAEHNVLLERYRLVIAANAILSDPTRREAYDRFGQGWDPSATYDPDGNSKYSTYHRWRKDGTAAYKWPTDQDPMYNATWEDWERWYREQANRGREQTRSYWTPNFFSTAKQSSTIYMSNYSFLTLIFLFAALGGIGQATRAHEGAKSRMARTQAVSEEIGKTLQDVRNETRARWERGERKPDEIRRFLAQRYNYNEGEFDGRALKPGEDDGVCASGTTKTRDEPKFWEKPPDDEGRPGFK